MFPPKSIPAYKGARFDAHGFCLVHSDVRLCQITSNGQYRIVRKTCFKCGTAAFMTDAHMQKINSHGYKKKSLQQRGIPSKLHAATLYVDKRKQHRSHAHHGNSNRRARTLSPHHRRRDSPRSQKKTLSKSHVMQQMSNDQMKELMKIQPPLFAKSSSKGSGHNNATNNEEKFANKDDRKRSYEGHGHCHAHPEVCLDVHRRVMSNGEWRISKDVCPRCFPKVDINDKNHTKKLGLPTSSPATPKSILCFDDYFVSALTLYDNKEVEQEVCHSPTHFEVTEKRSNAMIMPKSSARIARADKKRREGRSHNNKVAYAAWKVPLPLY